MKCGSEVGLRLPSFEEGQRARAALTVVALNALLEMNRIARAVKKYTLRYYRLHYHLWQIRRDQLHSLHLEFVDFWQAIVSRRLKKTGDVDHVCMEDARLTILPLQQQDLQRVVVQR